MLQRPPLSKEDQDSFLEAQSAIYPAIGQELIALTPESWRSAVLKMVANPSGMAHSIYSEEGRREVVAPSMELFEHTYKLEVLFRKYGHMWAVAYFSIAQNAEGQWSFDVKYEYPAV